MASRDESDEKFNWSNTWLADIFMSGKDAAKYQAEIERLHGITPETKRLAEIKAGVITASIGVGLMIVLFVIMNGIILSGQVSEAAAEILSRIWIAGVIPVFIGLALIFNGIVVSRRSIDSAKPQTDADPGPTELSNANDPAYLSPAETNQLSSGVPSSVVDDTTKHLAKERVSEK